MIADNFEDIAAQIARIKREQAEGKTADVPEEPKQIQHQTYMGWDIYAPVYPA